MTWQTFSGPWGPSEFSELAPPLTGTSH